jgi:uncharacterized protein (DUF427 family)
VEPSARHVVVMLGGVVVADTRRALRVLETSHPPSWYLPPEDCDLRRFEQAPGRSFCEWKGTARYWTVRAGGEVAERAAWSYPDPTPGFAAIRDHVALYPSVFDCTVDGERVVPQDGGFYGGWITADVVGPFKGAPGTEWW